MSEPPPKKKKVHKAPGANLGAGHTPSATSSSSSESPRAPPNANRSRMVLRSRFGQNTIESEHLVGVVANLPAGRDYVKRSFFDLENYFIRRQDVRISYQAPQHGVVIQSQIARPATAAGIQVYPPISMTLGGYEPQLKLTVRHQMSLKLPYIERACRRRAGRLHPRRLARR